MGQDKNSETHSVLSESETRLIKNNITCSEVKKDEKRHKCTYPGCEAAYCRPSRLMRHFRSHTGERSYKCNYENCDKAYTNACHLKRHMETHSDIKTMYQCPECSIFIAHRYNLKRHYKTQHEREKLTCKECNASFTKKYQLAAHKATHNPVLYKCEKCNKSFTNPTKFKNHKATHEKLKQYPCTRSGCNEVFENWILFQSHLKTQHVNDYKCKDCDKRFLQKHHLRVHSQVHIKHRLLIPCPYEKCPRVYYFQKNLDQHIRVYHLDQKYECDICKIKITTKRRLTEHIQKLHMLETRIKRTKKLQRKRRKDADKPKRSMVSKLTGIILPQKVEKEILERKDFSLEKFIEVLNEN
nr:PREDICTED: zinc finger protein 845 [Megachile rotundata]XP_012140845.1 PREDICTED: zinc finger protein 845 [Megachile rotundata]